MRALSRELRVLILVVALADLMAFSELTSLTLVTVTTGTITMFLGVVYYYRPASVLGLLIVTSGAAASIDIPTLTETGTLLAGLLGVLAPVFILFVLALPGEEEAERGSMIAMRATATALAFMIGCLLSVPLAVFLVSLTAPGLSLRMDAMAEMGVMLVVAMGAGTMLTWRQPRVRGSPEVESPD